MKGTIATLGRPVRVNRASPLASGLIGWWPTLSSRGANMLHDLSGYSRNAAVTGAPPWAPDTALGMAPDYSSGNDYRVAYDAAFNTAPFTVSLWCVLTGGSGTYRGIIGTRPDASTQGWIIYATDANRLEFWTARTDYSWSKVASGVTATLNVPWHMVISFAADGAMMFYINGAPYGPTTNSLYQINPDGAMALGRNGDNGLPTTGRIGDVAFWDRVLSPAEAAQLYQEPWALYDTAMPVWVVAGGGTDELTASNLTAGTPSLGTPTIAQAHALTADALTAGAPSLATTAISQVHGLTADATTAGSPTLATPALAQIHALTASTLTAGAPALATPTLGQTHALIATGVTAGTPTLGTPACAITTVLTANALTAGTPTLGSPAITQLHALSTAALVAGVAILGNPALGQLHNLTATGIVAGSPILGSPALGGAWTDISLLAIPFTAVYGAWRQTAEYENWEQSADYGAWQQTAEYDYDD